MSTIYLEEYFCSILQSRCPGVICHIPHGAAVVVWGQPCSQTWPKWWNILTWAQHPAKLYCILECFWLGSLAEQVFVSLWRAAQLPPAATHSDQPISCREQPRSDQPLLERSVGCQQNWLVFATRWKLWFSNFFSFFQIHRHAITMFYFTLASSVFLSPKYFEQSFRCVTTLRDVDPEMKHFDLYFFGNKKLGILIS